MQNRFGSTAAGCALAVAWLTGAANAQTSAPAGPASSAVTAPTYVSIPLEIAVNRPATDVWKRVGKYCDIGEWLRIPCTITSGKDGEFGAVRSVGAEVLVGKTELSYTYTQTVKDGRPYNLCVANCKSLSIFGLREGPLRMSRQGRRHCRSVGCCPNGRTTVEGEPPGDLVPPVSRPWRI